MLGKGVLKGMRVTIGRFFETYINDLKYFPRVAAQEAVETRNRADTKGLMTIEYPEQKLEMFEGFRMIPFLVYDEDPENPRCTACGICARVCPPQCIWIERDQTPEGRPMKRPRNFTIDATICMSCGLCAEFCPFDAIKMNNDYEISAYDRYVDLVYHKDKLLRPVEYYAKIHPTEHAIKEEEKREKEEAKRKAAEARAKKAAAAAATKKD